MTDTTVAAATGHPMQSAHRAYVAAHPTPQAPDLDMIDLCCSFGAIRFDALYLERQFDDAEDRGEARAPTLRAHLDDLRHMQAALALLVAEAEAEAA